MSDPKTPFELMMAQAQEMAKAFNPALETFNPKGFEKLWPTMPKDMMITCHHVCRICCTCAERGSGSHRSTGLMRALPVPSCLAKGKKLPACWVGV